MKSGGRNAGLDSVDFTADFARVSRPASEDGLFKKTRSADRCYVAVVVVVVANA